MTATLRYCMLAQDCGMSLRTALEAYRLAGGAIRTEAFSIIWKAAADKRALGEHWRRLRDAS